MFMLMSAAVVDVYPYASKTGTPAVVGMNLAQKMFWEWPVAMVVMGLLL